MRERNEHIINDEALTQRVVDNEAYISTLCELVEEGKDVVLNIAGSSMSPFLIHRRDAVMLRRISRAPVCGDIVLFQRLNGAYVVHRIVKIDDKGFYMIGDAQTETEGPIGYHQLRAVVNKVRRKGKWIGCDQLMWRFFATIWLWFIPLRPLLIRCWSLTNKMICRNG